MTSNQVVGQSSRSYGVLVPDRPVGARLHRADQFPAAQKPVASARLALSFGVLLAVPLLALNLRPAVTSVGAMLADIQTGTGMSAVLASAVVAAPVWCFAVGGALAWAMRARLGTSRTVSMALAALAVTLACRVLAGPYLLLAGTVVACLAIAVLGTLLPVITHAAPARAWALLTGCYVAAMGGGSGIGALVTPTVAGHSSWQLGVSGWALLAAAAWAVWRVASRRFVEPPVRATKHTGPRSLAPAGTAWSLTLHFGLTSGFTFSIMGWLPSILTEYSHVDPVRVEWMFTVAMALGVPVALLVPKWARTTGSQSGLAVALAAPSLAATAGLLMYPGWSPWLWAVGLGLGMPAVGLALAMISMRSAPDGDTAAALSSMVQGIGYAIAGATALACGLLHSATQTWDWPLLALLIVLCGQVMFGMYAGQPITVYAGDGRAKPRHLAPKRGSKELPPAARRALPPAQPAPPTPPASSGSASSPRLLPPVRPPNPQAGPQTPHPSFPPPANGHGRPPLRNGGRPVPGSPRPRPTARRAHNPTLPPRQAPRPGPATPAPPGPFAPKRGQVLPPPGPRPAKREPALAADESTTAALPPKPNVDEPSTTDVLMPNSAMAAQSATDVVVPEPRADEPSTTDVLIPGRRTRPRRAEPATDPVRSQADRSPVTDPVRSQADRSPVTDPVVPESTMAEAPSATEVVVPKAIADQSATEVVVPTGRVDEPAVARSAMDESPVTEAVTPRTRAATDQSATEVVVPEPRAVEPSATDVLIPKSRAAEEPSPTEVVVPGSIVEQSATEVVVPGSVVEQSATEVVVPESSAVEPSATEVVIPESAADQSVTEVVMPEPRAEVAPSATEISESVADQSATEVVVPEPRQAIDQSVTGVAIPEPGAERADAEVVPEPRAGEPAPAERESAEPDMVGPGVAEPRVAERRPGGPRAAEPATPRAQDSHTPVQLELALIHEPRPEPGLPADPMLDPTVVREPTSHIPHPRLPSS